MASRELGHSLTGLPSQSSIRPLTRVLSKLVLTFGYETRFSFLSSQYFLVPVLRQQRLHLLQQPHPVPVVHRPGHRVPPLQGQLHHGERPSELGHD